MTSLHLVAELTAFFFSSEEDGKGRKLPTNMSPVYERIELNCHKSIRS